MVETAHRAGVGAVAQITQTQQAPRAVQVLKAAMVVTVMVTQVDLMDQAAVAGHRVRLALVVMSTLTIHMAVRAAQVVHPQ
jgi:hypothetical protein